MIEYTFLYIHVFLDSVFLAPIFEVYSGNEGVVYILSDYFVHAVSSVCFPGSCVLISN